MLGGRDGGVGPERQRGVGVWIWVQEGETGVWFTREGAGREKCGCGFQWAVKEVGAFELSVLHRLA